MKVMRARELIARAMRAASSVLLLQTLSEFSNVAIRKARIPVKDIRRIIDAWRAVMRYRQPTLAIFPRHLRL
jgi:predicted nucleic acid-binding protein